MDGMSYTVGSRAAISYYLVRNCQFTQVSQGIER